MKRPGPRAVSRGAFIVLALVIAYFVFGDLALSMMLTSNLLVILVVLLVIVSAIALPFIDKAFGDKLPFLSTWPSPPANSRVRRVLGAGGSNSSYSIWRASTKREITASVSFLFTPFLVLVAIGGIVSLFRPVSSSYFSMVSYTLFGGCIFPGLLGMAFRLRKRYDLKNVLFAIGLFSPINALLLITTFFLVMLLNGNTLGDSTSYLLFICGFGVFFTAIFTLTYFAAKDPLPAPAFTYRPLYLRAEIALAIASYAAVALIILLTS